MVFDLPDPGNYRLDLPPLRQAHAEIRFPLIARFQTLDGVAGIQGRLQDRFPFMRRRDVAEMGIKIGPEGPEKPEVGTSSTWELSNDEGLFVTVGPAVASL